FHAPDRPVREVARPETELLAGWAVEQARHVAGPPEGPGACVVDLCTGSGAIAAAVAAEVPGARVHAVELDEAAHAWAARNLAGTGVDLRHGDMAEAFPDLVGAVDVVACNPPYIPLEAWESVEPEARDHDPHRALFSGADGLAALRVLERRAALLLRVGGVVGAEHADVQGDAAVALFAGAGRWTEVVDHRDLAGRPRFVTARLAR
ncbi:MAG TPA: HemK/PrmC family methyltransferase, partial [Nocardioides sp.]|uniref:N5-glutamine methyltransferase family protein n=1 Tax=Nocardioides sp. TaxID=35761 RepID=UPI002BD43D68